MDTHKHWYHDGVEDDEDLWRLDPIQDIQVQVSVNVVQDPTEKDKDVVHGNDFSLFIEHDVRKKSPHDPAERIKYSGDVFPITADEARKLLLMDNATAVVYLKEKIDHVIALPNDPKYCK